MTPPPGPADGRAGPAPADDLPDAAWVRSFRRRLTAWGALRGRHDLPWRRKPADPYAVWISEVMLQQTTVAAVVPYFHRFLAALPTVADLAAADEETVLRLWEGLGYYRRARQLHAAARRIVDHHGGQVPADPEQLAALPGVGRYTVGAILAFAFDRPAPIVEANTQRLYLRLLAEPGEAATATVQRRLWRFAERIVPARGPGAFNLALMDLGATVCLPRSPRCPVCPVRPLCPTAERGLTDRIPAPKRHPAVQQVRAIALVATRPDGRLLLRRCRPGERFAGLWDVPRFDRPAAGATELPSDEDVTDEITIGLVDRHLAGRFGLVRRSDLAPLGVIRHGVTRFAITLDVVRLDVEEAGPPPAAADPPETLDWVTVDELADRPLSMSGRKIARLLEADRPDPRRLF